MNMNTEELRIVGFIATFAAFAILVLWAGLTSKPTKTETSE